MRSARARFPSERFPLIVFAALALGFAPGFAVAVVGAVLVGLGNGAMDVAMNALGVQVESARHRPIMSFFHAFFSVGNLAGAGSVLIMSSILGLTGGSIVTPLMIMLALVGVATLAVLIKITPEAAVVQHTPVDWSSLDGPDF
jgi:MFS family permease